MLKATTVEAVPSLIAPIASEETPQLGPDHGFFARPRGVMSRFRTSRPSAAEHVLLLHLCRKCGQLANLDLPSKVSTSLSPTAKKRAATFFAVLCTSITHKPSRTSKLSQLKYHFQTLARFLKPVVTRHELVFPNCIITAWRYPFTQQSFWRISRSRSVVEKLGFSQSIVSAVGTYMNQYGFRR